MDVYEMSFPNIILLKKKRYIVIMVLGENMKEHGFTLVELIAVIVILGLLALVAVPAVTGIIKNSKDEFARAFFDEDVQQRIFRFYDSVREKIKVENANILDLSNLLLNKQEVVYDYIHCDTKGNQLIAENIAKYIIQYL